jgi:1-acyl-sn-glycerol-3-phosphate acyltransferase
METSRPSPKTPNAPSRIRQTLPRLAGSGLRGLARVVTGVRPRFAGGRLSPQPTIYYANHTSHGDFVLIWTVLPSAIRAVTRPVAGADYWQNGRVRQYVADAVFDAVLIERGKLDRNADPTAPVLAALDAGASVIIFPEGTRNTTDAPLLPFKAGLYRLAEARPTVPLVPVWIENVCRVIPKGELLPLPLLCSVTFGPATIQDMAERRPVFLERARSALLALRPREAAPDNGGTR